ncbi:hypothetical protein HJB89_25345 [Rhizobium sp. NZLR8]|uniref:hypothetical protein n=1 Tax=Rhizobium sp. NZLR8 TaxID=2731104 RepID=UPI001C82A9AE|nr:hypothetical protein [Rhizobium sp. NZLR8]MBX5160413.1 hypothetical protein [Rhizobium sp. NZLR8]
MDQNHGDAEGVASVDQHGDDELVGLAESDAQKQVRHIQYVLGNLLLVHVIACDKVDNGVAFHTVERDGLPADYTNADYIIYKKAWVDQKLNSDDLSINFLLGHEFGHIFNAHDTSAAHMPRKMKELQADYSGGCAVARLKGQWAPLESLVKNLRGDGSDNYENAETSLKWVRAGFRNCDGDPNPDYIGIRVVYFPKETDNGVVTQVLSSLDINYQPGISENEMATNGITCTTDYDFAKVRKLAIALTRAGANIYWINKAQTRLNAVKRITIESDDISETWTPLTTRQLACLNTCDAWNSENSCSSP